MRPTIASSCRSPSAGSGYRRCRRAQGEAIRRLADPTDQLKPDQDRSCLSVGRGITLSGEVNSCDKLFIAHRPSSYRAFSHSLGHNAVI